MLALPATLAAALAVAAPAAPAAPPDELPDLTGTWRVELSLTNEVKVPVLGTTRLRSQQTMRATLRRGPDGGLIQEHEACRVATVAEQQLVTTHFPPRFVAALPKKRYPVELKPQDNGQLGFFADLRPQFLGYDPALSPAGPPHELDDPALVDGDHDGKPGVTAIARAPVFGEVELYLAQAGHTLLQGVVLSADRIEGRAPMVRLDQWMVGSTNRLFHRNPEVTHRPDLSTFTMVRQPAGTTCADILAAGPLPGTAGAQRR